ncbi:MAG: hypothetical protein ACREKE_02960 [bacterium]
MRATSFNALIFGFARPLLWVALGLCLALAWAHDADAGTSLSDRQGPPTWNYGGTRPTQEQLDAVRDSFDWADGIISALADLAPPFGVSEPRLPSSERHRRRKLHFPVRIPVMRRVPIFVGRRLLLHRSTVFGIFDLTVTETGPRSFNLIVGSTEPAEDVQVQDRLNQEILVDQPLDDERVFRVRVPAPLSPRIAISVSLNQDGEIDRAYFPLLEAPRK